MDGEGVDLKNTVFLQLVQWPIVLIGLFFHIQRSLHEECSTIWGGKKPSNCREILLENDLFSPTANLNLKFMLGYSIPFMLLMFYWLYHNLRYYLRSMIDNIKQHEY